MLWNISERNKVFQIKLHTLSLEGKLPTPLAVFSKQTRNCYGNSCSKLGYFVIEKYCTLKVLPNISEKTCTKFLKVLSCTVSIPYLLDQTTSTLQLAGVV